MAKYAKKQIVTPRAIAVYPWLNRPDTKFNADGEYKVTLKIAAEEAAPLMKSLDSILEEYKSEAVKLDAKVARYAVTPPYEAETDDQGNLTGNYLFKFKQKAVVRTNDGREIKMTVPLFDANRTPTSVLVGGGSELKIAASVWPYSMGTTRTIGLSLKPTAVQILSLIALASSGAASMFESEEGFVAEEGDFVGFAETTNEGTHAADF